jgi:hypothetical protein
VAGKKKGKEKKRNPEMAYWHMDRARYYASVGDDARALRHLSKFGATEEAKTIEELKSEVKKLNGRVESLEKEDSVLLRAGQIKMNRDKAKKSQEQGLFGGIQPAEKGGCSVM